MHHKYRTVKAVTKKMLKNRLIYLTVSTCTPLIIMRTLQRKLIVKINSMKG